MRLLSIAMVAICDRLVLGAVQEPPQQQRHPPLYAKMVADPDSVHQNRRLADQHNYVSYSYSSTSKSFMTVASCGVGQSYGEDEKNVTFKLSAGEGHGVVCVALPDPNGPMPVIHLTLAPGEEGQLMYGSAEDGEDATAMPNCFGQSDDEGSLGFPFLYSHVPPNGATVQVTCGGDDDAAFKFVIVVIDEEAVEEQVLLETTVQPGQETSTMTMESTSEVTGAVTSNRQTKTRHVIRPQLLDPNSHIQNVRVETILGASSVTAEDFNPEASSHVQVVPNEEGEQEGNDQEDNTSGVVTLEDDQAGDIALVHYEIVSPDGNVYQRTHILSTPEPVPPVQPISIVSTAVSNSEDEDGDVHVILAGLPTDLKSNGDARRFLCTVRVGILLEGVNRDESGDEPTTVSLVDMSAMVTYAEPEIRVHGGWIRKKLEELGLSGRQEGWDVLIEDVVCADPNKSYWLTHTLHSDQDPGDRRLFASPSNEVVVGHHLLSARRTLSRVPSEEERQVSRDMLMGRLPKLSSSSSSLGEGEEGHRRDEVEPHRFILIPGYCAERNKWDETQFAGSYYNVFKYLVPNQGVSTDEFAVSIRDLACPYSGGMSGNIVGHSQAGAASLHLYNFYNSCLDNNSFAGRLIQSVGTPYQGTALAGAVADLGAVLGISCGSLEDMTESGATTWLSYMKPVARSEVTFYRTQYEDKQWSYDYCNIFSHAVIDWPDDGLLVVSRGYLPGGNDAGVSSKQCHVEGMRDPFQIWDADRNSEMRSTAAVPLNPQTSQTFNDTMKEEDGPFDKLGDTTNTDSPAPSVSAPPSSSMAPTFAPPLL
ncbi:hypothetical protein ACA910_009839 [Epithemia clementina (nom. ined.)]